MASVKKIKVPSVQNPYDIYGAPSAVLTSTLTAGQTSLAFTNAAITSTARFEVYTEDVYIALSNIERSNTTLTLTFPEQSSNVNVKVVVYED